MGSIDSHINVVTGLLNQISHCNNLVTGRQLLPPAKNAIKAEAKKIVDDAKGELDQIKQEITDW
ncbi:hypothetical protein ES703_116096 [subsurface metagenome]